MSYVSVRIAKVENNRAIYQAYHDWRIKPPKYLKTEPNALIYTWEKFMATPTKALTDPESKEMRNDKIKQILNKYMVEAEDTYRRCTEKKPQKTTKYFKTGIITFSREEYDKAEDKTSFTRKLFEHGRELIDQYCERLNVKPVYAAIHLDEANPHIHFIVTNTDKETGRSVTKKINPQFLRDLQDIAGQIYADMGYDRGQSKDVTGAHHKSVRELHRMEQNRLEAELETIKNEIRRLRKTRDEMKAMENEERKMHNEQISSLRQQQRELKELKKRYDAEKVLWNQIAENKERRTGMTTDFLRRLRQAGVQVAMFARRNKAERNKGDWREDYAPTDVSALNNLRGFATDLHKSTAETHIRLCYLPPVFCLDDIDPDTLLQIRKELGTIAEVQTSENNYQVWIAFADVKQLKPNAWDTVNDYLVNKYGADQAANRKGHYYRVPGFMRADNHEWIATMDNTPFKSASKEKLQQIVHEWTPKIEEKKEIKKRLEECACIPQLICDVPDWFANKFRDRWNSNATKQLNGAQEKEIDESRVDWTTTWQTLLPIKDKKKRLLYASYIVEILEQSAELRNKSKDYARHTVEKAMMELER